jgi:hypothetical protein
VIVGAGKSIVLCAVNWIGIANEGHDYREKLADDAGTTPDRVAVHCTSTTPRVVTSRPSG